MDFHLTNTTASTNTFVGVAGLNTLTGSTVASVANSRLVPQFTGALPGFIGRVPGGQTASDGRSPSPTMFLIAPASTYATAVAGTHFTEIAEPASRYFDDLDDVGFVEFTEWCQTEILGIRATLNSLPINSPVYFCRTRADDN